MARIMGIDYGTKRVGIAVTDPLQIIVSGLTTVPTGEIFDFLEAYLNEEQIEKFVVGEPMHPDGNPAQITPQINTFILKLRATFPEIPVDSHDERYSSKSARDIILQSGARKKKRQDKSLVDKISAVLILQDYLKH